jgi:O-antigen ligase
LIGAIMSYLVLILTQTATAYIALCAAAAFIAFLLTLRAFQAPSANSEGRTGSRRPFMQRKGAWPLRALAAIMMAAILFIATYLISDPVRDLIRWSPSPASAESAIPSAEEGAAGEGMSSAAQTPPSISLIASDAPDSITGASETAPSAEATAEATVAPTVSPAPLAWRAGHTFQSKDILQRLETLLSGDNRMQVWRLIFTMFKSDPARLLFGIAPSDMREALYPYAEASGASNLAAIINNNNAHNSYLQTILSSGLPGLILWLALAAWAFFPAARKCLNRGVPARSAFLLGFAAACLIMGLAESHYLAQGFVMNLVFFIALGAARTEAADDGQADR